MRLDKLEQAAARHASDGFCRVIGCPECEVRRQERFGGKTLDKVKVEVVEGNALDIKLEQANRTIDDLERRLGEADEAKAELTQLVIDANERAQALGAEICGFVAAMVESQQIPPGSEEFEEFVGLLQSLALVKLHDASHRLAPVQHD